MGFDVKTLDLKSAILFFFYLYAEILPTIYYSILKNRYHSCLASTRRSQTLRPMPQGGAKGQTLGHVKIFKFIYFSFFSRIIFVFEQQILFRADILCVSGP